MKTLMLIFSLVFAGVVGLMAQSNPNDLEVTGYVTDSSGAAIYGHWVCVNYFGNDPTIVDSICTTTNANGWYSIIIENGSVIGPNQQFEAITADNCTGAWQIVPFSNGQGTLDGADVNFVFNCNPNPVGTCGAFMNLTQSSPDSTVIIAQASATGNAPFTYQWDNGTTGQSTYYDFPSGTGSYGVCLTVVDATGCVATVCDTAYLNQPSCDAYFYYASTPNGTIIANTNAQFTYSGQSENLAYFNWTVQGGGTTLSSDSMNPNFVFTAAGVYNVCLEVGDGQGCTNSFCASVTVVGGNTGGCQAYFALEDSSGYSYFVNYTQGSATQWFWDFGDGNTSTQMHPWHEYAQDGTYMVCLTVAGSNCQDTYCDTVVVGSNTGNCNASFSTSGLTPTGYLFSAAIQNPNSAYVWSVDGDSTSANGADLLVPGFTDGDHIVCLTIYEGNCSDTQCYSFQTGQDSCYGFISGQVFAGTTNQPVDIAEVYLIAYDSLSGQLTAVQTTWADSGGYYYFMNVPCGEYLIKAAAIANSAFYVNHLPTYYGNSTFWQYAEEVGVSWVQPAVQYDITLIGGNNPGGPGFIGGDVTQGANKVADEGDPIEGIAVMLFDMAGNAIAYTYTDANGQFGFDNLAYGSYQVYTELLNFTTIPAVVAITEEDPSVDGLHIFVSEELITTGLNETDFDALVGAVYPNPMSGNGSLTVNFAQGHEVQVKVIDLSGRIVSSTVQNLLAGRNTVAIHGSDLAEGYYILSIGEVSGAFTVTRKFVVTR